MIGIPNFNIEQAKIYKNHGKILFSFKELEKLIVDDEKLKVDKGNWIINDRILQQSLNQYTLIKGS